MAYEKRTDRIDSSCFVALVDPEVTKDRLVYVSKAVAQVVKYRQFLLETKKSDEGNGCGSRLNRQVAERSYALERDVRVAIKIGMDTLNELNDSGMLTTWLHAASISYPAGTSLFPPTRGWERFRRNLQEKIPAVDPSFVKEVENMATQYKMSVQSGEVGVPLLGEFQSLDGNTQRVKLLVDRPPGSLGRVSSADLFRTDTDWRIGMSAALPSLPGCHTVTGVRQQLPSMFSIYETLVGGFVFARDTAYRQARQADELGLTQFSGGEWTLLGALILLLVLLAIGLTVAATVYGILCAKNHNGFDKSADDCQLALNLLLGGGVATAFVWGLSGGGHVTVAASQGITISIA